MIKVISVSVYPNGVTITKGKWYYGAYAVVNASSDCYKDVEWYSDNSAIASVNKTTGYIYGVNPGTTRIYARSIFDGSKIDYITVTVAAPVAVTGVSVSPTTKMMSVGESTYLCETVYPSNATNQTVTWCSSDEDVATVGLYNGKVTAKKVGVATITACTVDGGYSASCVVTVRSTDPFHHSNIEFLRIKKYDMSSYGGDGEITTIVTKSILSSEQYFEAMAADRANVAFVIDSSLKIELNRQITLYQSAGLMFTAPYYFYLAKLGVDDMVLNGIIDDKSAEYYGIWASEANRLLQEVNKISSQIQLTLAIVSVVYSIYNIVSAIKTAKMSVNSTQTYYSASYKAAVNSADELFDELSASGTKYTKEKTMWIGRRIDGKICWLETGTEDAGFKHILNGHPVSDFSSFNVSSEVGVSSLIYNTISTKTPIGTYGADGLVYSYGNNKYLNIVISTNGYIVNAYNVSNDISRINFY